MEQEKKVLLTVDTGSSEKTVKSLKKDISDLKDAILNLEKGSDAYNDAVEQLQQNQRELDEVMALTKKTATALDGSYDALVHQMSLLKKEWRATADEAKRADLGKQIDNINAQLKEMDASVGNFQRNVGNYVSHWEGMPEVTKDFGTAMREMNEQIEPTKQKFESVGKIASGLASGFAAAQGAMALLGIESDEFEQTMIKLQGAIALAQGVGGLSGLVEGLGKAKVAFGAVDTSVKTVNKTMGKTGWLAIILLIITAVTTLVAHLKKKNEQIKDGTTALKQYNKIAREAQSNMAGEILKVQLLEKVATDITETTKNRTKAAEELCRLMGKQATDANILAVQEGKLKKEINDVTASMIKQAVATAQMEKLTELYKEYLDTQTEGATAWKDFVPPWFKMISGGIGEVAEWIFGGIDDAEENFEQRLADARVAYEKFAKALLENTDTKDLLVALGLTDDDDNSGGGGGNVAKKVEEVTKTIQKSIAEIANADIAHIEKVYTRKIATAKMEIKEKEAAAKKEYKLTLEKENEKLDVIKDAIKDAYAFEETNQKTIDTLKKKQVEQEGKVAKAKTEKTKEEEEAKLKVIKDALKAAEDAQKENGNIISSLVQDKADKELEIEQIKYNELERLRLLALEKERNAIATSNAKLAFEHQLLMRQLAIDTPSSQEPKKRGFFGSILGLGGKDEQKAEKAQRDIDNEYYKQAFEEEQNFLSEKLRINQEFLAKTTDADTRIQLEQVIADTQLQIEESKYAEKERLRQFDLQKEKEKQQKTQAIFTASLNATADLLGGIADLYESDEKNAEKNAKKIKGLRIAEATINTINGAVGAFSMAASTIPPPAGIIIGAVQAAAVTAAGIANIMKIKNTKTDGSGNGSGLGASVTPTPASYSSELPATYVRNVTSASETDLLNQDTRVYILESDIQESNKRVSVRESESSF